MAAGYGLHLEQISLQRRNFLRTKKRNRQCVSSSGLAAIRVAWFFSANSNKAIVYDLSLPPTLLAQADEVIE